MAGRAMGLQADVPLLGLTACHGTADISMGTVQGGQLMPKGCRLTGDALSHHLLTPSAHLLLKVHAPAL